MSVIYQPKGRAREYSPYALNLYMGCTHKCKYCYAPSCIQKAKESYYEKPLPRKNLLENLEKELQKNRPTEQVLLSFIGDVYCETQDENELTRNVLKTLSENHVPTAVLTKGGYRSLKDIDVLKTFENHIHVGATLTFYNEKLSREWEPGAADPIERIEVLSELRKNNITTFASFEPVIDKEESLKLIDETLKLECVDIYKIGKINHNKEVEESIDWNDFLQKAIERIREAKKRVYVKHDLRESAYKVKLYGNEVLCDEFNAK